MSSQMSHEPAQSKTSSYTVDIGVDRNNIYSVASVSVLTVATLVSDIEITC